MICHKDSNLKGLKMYYATNPFVLPSLNTLSQGHSHITYLTAYLQFFSYLFIVPFRTRVEGFQITCEPRSKSAYVSYLTITYLKI